ncbi:MAG: cell division protein FtsQ/DivIB [Betaproteobacteria bacterium]|jgi:cell division protein FtsQ|nr:cell division protein FtsQ/DivIB [Betaproteobacteria bacterium]
MWDSPRILNSMARGLFLAAGAIAVYLVARAAMSSTLFPLRTVSVVGDLQHVSGEAIRTGLAGRVSGNFFAANLDVLRGALEQIPWVRRAAVRRQWPDHIQVRIEEHVPIARWTDRRLVNTYGELFNGDLEAALPLLGGPPGAERQVAARYAAFNALLAPLGTQLAQLVLSPRHAWQIKLASGTTLELGRERPREPAEARLARFVSAYPQVVAELGHPVEHVDLRYPNGFAVRVPASATQADGKARASGASRRKLKE